MPLEKLLAETAACRNSYYQMICQEANAQTGMAVLLLLIHTIFAVFFPFLAFPHHSISFSLSLSLYKFTILVSDLLESFNMNSTREIIVASCQQTLCLQRETWLASDINILHHQHQQRRSLRSKHCCTIAVHHHYINERRLVLTSVSTMQTLSPKCKHAISQHGVTTCL